MKCLYRNQRPIYYATYLSKQAVVDTDGFETGEVAATYSSPPTLMRAYVSAAKGSADIEIFGTSLDYDKVMITADTSCPVDENSHLWVDRTPTDGDYDYVVKRVSASLNSITYAIKRVNQ